MRWNQCASIILVIIKSIDNNTIWVERMIVIQYLFKV